MTVAEIVSVVVTAIAGIMVPIALLIVGNWYTKQKEKADEAQRTADRMALLLKHLASENTRERMLALQVLQYLRQKKEFPPELTNTVTAITFRDSPDIAGAALLAMGGTTTVPDEIVLLELLAPLKIQFDRTREAFQQWGFKDEHTERMIKQSNEATRDLLITRGYLVPKDLQSAARRLVEHYNEWLKEYERVYKDGVRDPQVGHVFVGPKGFPFPHDAEEQFLARFQELQTKLMQRASSGS